ncbi:unnamed protein product, partial [Allacma fusca]
HDFDNLSSLRLVQYKLFLFILSSHNSTERESMSTPCKKQRSWTDVCDP